MSGEWSGWQQWNRWESAGVVENTLDFSEEAIIVDHAVGRTKNAIGRAWAIDAAVAYSLMKAGPDARLTWADLVNDQTRAATIIMTNKVGYGQLPDVSVDSCGHDEFMGYEITLGAPFVNAQDYLTFQTSGYSGKNMSDWMDVHCIPEDHPARKCAKFRDTVNRNYNATHLFANDFFKPLLALLREKFGDTWTIDSNASITRYQYFTRGECKWKGDDGKLCAHHDDPKIFGWGMLRTDDGFKKLYSKRSVSGGWNNDQFRAWKTKHSDVVMWDEVRRSMIADVPDTEVINQIKKALLRMLKRNDNIVSKMGRGKTAVHWWSDWGWLAEMASYVKNTNSKKRKEGDIANGWKYTKVNSRMSFGHEIADFVWYPQNEIKDYIVGRKEVGDWNPRGILNNFRFPSKAQAEAFASAIVTAHSENGGFLANRVHKGFEKDESDSQKWTVRSYDVTLVMKGTVDPEDYLAPTEVVTMWRNAAPAVLADHKENFTRIPQYKISAVVNNG